MPTFYFSKLYFADFEGIEVHSRKVFNVPKEKTAISKDSEESVGPMVSRTVRLLTNY